MLKQLAVAGAAAALAAAAGATARVFTPEPTPVSAPAVVAAAPPRLITSLRPPTVRIMPLGDSITFGVGSRSAGSYRADLMRLLAGTGLAVDLVGSQRSGPGPDRDNEGHGGWTIADIAAQAPGWLATYRPDVVLLHIGTNDIARKVDVPRAPARLSALLDVIRAARPGAQVLVQQIVGSRKPKLQARIAAFNAALPAIVAAKDSRVHLVDQSGVTAVDLYDMVHPNDFGYAKMSYALYTALGRVLGPFPPVANPGAVDRAWICHRPAGRQREPDCRWWHRRDAVWRTHQVGRWVAFS